MVNHILVQFKGFRAQFTLIGVYFMVVYQVILVGRLGLKTYLTRIAFNIFPFLIHSRKVFQFFPLLLFLFNFVLVLIILFNLIYFKNVDQNYYWFNTFQTIFMILNFLNVRNFYRKNSHDAFRCFFISFIEYYSSSKQAKPTNSLPIKLDI